jgi:7,8-dihydropterin-6-yl-methyl-4-(beta-D-ribofuranosyl)aminobenzene 5'-phosphate synthase
VKITVLVNDYSNCSLPAEHGLCLHVEYNGKQILIDSGQGATFLQNAKRMGIDASKINFAILTHGHYDHANGMRYLDNPTVFTHQNSFKQRYRLLESGFEFNGVSFSSYAVKCVFNSDFCEIDKGVYLSGTVPTPNAVLGHNFFEQDKITPDALDDEQIVVFEASGGLVVIASCTHFGVENMTDFLRARFPNKRVVALFAGLHISKLHDKELSRVIDYLAQCDLYQKIYALHCTGEKAGRIIEQQLNGKLVSVGNVYQVS